MLQEARRGDADAMEGMGQGDAAREAGAEGRSGGRSDTADAGTRAEAAKRALVAEYHIDSSFVGVQKLARILGLSAASIHAYMRQGKFFMPWRLFNKSPVVKIDDLVDWYCSKEYDQPWEPEPPPPAPRCPVEERIAREARNAGRKPPVQTADEMLAETLAELAAQGIYPTSTRKRRKRSASD